MIALPRFPIVERSESWRASKLMRPLCERLEDFFSHPSRRRATITDELRDGITEEMTPIVNKPLTASIKEATQNVWNTRSRRRPTKPSAR